MTNTTGSPPLARRSMEPRFLALALACVVVLAIFHFQGNSVQQEAFGHSAFRWMVGRWGDTVSYGGVDYSHGWLLPFVTGWLIWRRREELGAVPHRVCPWGLWLIAGALLMNYVGLQVAQTRISLFSLVVLLWALPLYLYGREVAGKLLFPVAYLIFCIPLTFLDSLTFPLRMLAAKASAVVLNGLGIEAIRSGARIISTAGEGFQFDVADACSGLRSLLAIAAITSVYAYLTQRSTWRRWVLFLSAVPLAMAGNMVRIVTVALFALVFGQENATRLYHDYSGYLVFAVVVLLMVGLGKLLNRPQRGTEGLVDENGSGSPTEGEGAVRANEPRMWHFTALAGILCAGGLLFAVRPEIRTDETCDVKADLPTQLGPWVGDEVRYCTKRQCLNEEVRESFGSNAVCTRCGSPMGTKSIGEVEFLPSDTTVIKRRYRGGDRGPYLVTIVITGADREGIHRPERCLVAQGSQVVKTRRLIVPLTGREDLVLTSIATMRQTNGTADGEATDVGEFFAYWFAGQGRETPSHLERMFWLARDRVTKGVASRWAYISISGRRPTESDRYLDDIKAFVAQLHDAIVLKRE